LIKARIYEYESVYIAEKMSGIAVIEDIFLFERMGNGGHFNPGNQKKTSSLNAFFYLL
jgi:hypothetical protein